MLALNLYHVNNDAAATLLYNLISRRYLTRITRAAAAAAGRIYTAINSNMALPVDYVEIDGVTYPTWKAAGQENASPVYVSDKLTAKMAGMLAISTSCVENHFCACRMINPELICFHCFARGIMINYAAAGEHGAQNADLLTTHIVPADLLPRFKRSVQIVRIEATGDVANVTQAINYIHIAQVNPHVTFAWWSKNPGIIDKAIKAAGRPENVVFIASSPRLNEQERIRYSWIDKVFTVYDADHAGTVEINCGARSCKTCRRCYSHDTERIINELLK